MSRSKDIKKVSIAPKGSVDQSTRRSAEFSGFVRQYAEACQVGRSLDQKVHKAVSSQMTLLGVEAMMCLLPDSDGELSAADQAGSISGFA